MAITKEQVIECINTLGKRLFPTDPYDTTLIGERAIDNYNGLTFEIADVQGPASKTLDEEWSNIDRIVNQAPGGDLAGCDEYRLFNYGPKTYRYRVMLKRGGMDAYYGATPSYGE